MNANLIINARKRGPCWTLLEMHIFVRLPIACKDYERRTVFMLNNGSVLPIIPLNLQQTIICIESWDTMVMQFLLVTN